MDGLISATLDNVTRLCAAGYYSHIVIGSGIGGGVLARSLVEPPEPPLSARVLLIERGGLLLSTPCINIPSPRWNQESLEGPSMDNAFVYNALKGSFATSTRTSSDYVGGPVYGIGGRSTVWGLYTPMLACSQLEYFPKEVQRDLNLEHYNRAYRIMTRSQETSISRPYPENPIHRITTTKDSNTTTVNIFQDLVNIKQKISASFQGEFEFCPMAAEFTARSPGSMLYQTVMGGYTTATWILEQVFNKSEGFTLLSQTEVVAINPVQPGSSPNRAETLSVHDDHGKPPNRPRNRVESLTVLDDRGKERITPTKNATVILCAGTIDTAAIALRSGLGNDNDESPVGRGLTDHDIWGTRFRFQGGNAVRLIKSQALRLQQTMKLDPNTDHRDHGQIDCLVNITINAPSFVGQNTKEFTVQHIDKDDKLISKELFMKNEAEQKDDSCTVQVVYCFPSRLVDENRVLNLPERVPTIQIRKIETYMYTDAMQRVAWKIINQLRCRDAETDVRVPLVSRAGFGVVAHEVGTMRMGTDPETSVVDSNLRVHGWENLAVCDLSVFPVSPSSNPSLTLAVLAQRLADHLLGRVMPPGEDCQDHQTTKAS